MFVWTVSDAIDAGFLVVLVLLLVRYAFRWR